MLWNRVVHKTVALGIVVRRQRTPNKNYFRTICVHTYGIGGEKSRTDVCSLSAANDVYDVWIVNAIDMRLCMCAFISVWDICVYASVSTYSAIAQRTWMTRWHGWRPRRYPSDVCKLNIVLVVFCHKSREYRFVFDSNKTMLLLVVDRECRSPPCSTGIRSAKKLYRQLKIKWASIFYSKKWKANEKKRKTLSDIWTFRFIRFTLRRRFFNIQMFYTILSNKKCCRRAICHLLYDYKYDLEATSF